MLNAVVGGPRLLLRLEGLALLLVSVLGYAHLQFDWALFGWCFFLPDVALLGYLAGARAGALAYNCTHSTLLPLALLAAGFYAGEALCQTAGLIGLAHIGFDRALGYGLKYAQGFRVTHLGVIGRTQTPPPA